MTQGTVFHLRNVLVLVGIIITAVGIIYFASELIDRLSDWGRVLSLGLLATALISLGRYFELTGEPTELVEAKGWRWLRIPSALYILGLVSVFAALIVFLGIDTIDRLLKAAVVILAGLAVLLVGARRIGAEQDA